MNRALRFQKRLSVTGGAVVTILLRAFNLAFRSTATSSNHERDPTECYRPGVNGYIQKPVDLPKSQETPRHLGVYWLVVNQIPSFSS
ncbi:MAG: hypothetical protein WBR10_14390 [Candidatus Acidiferrum sp.]